MCHDFECNVIGDCNTERCLCADNFFFYYSPIPEVDSWAMLLAGLGLMGVIARRRSALAS